jgi:hypothetical protein
MARIRFYREEKFLRGDLILQIYIDGAKAGSLIGASDLELDIQAGTHSIQARMFGQKGPAMVLDVKSDQDIAVSGTRTPNISTWLVVTAVAMYLVPGGRLEWLRWALLAVVMTGFFFWQRKFRPGLLRLKVYDHAEPHQEPALR